MKTKIASFVVAVFALLSMSSCTLVVDGNNRPCGIAPQAVHVGTFGPGQQRQYHPITGLPGQCALARGTFVAGLCGPNGPYAGGGFQTRNQIPQQWGQVNPYVNAGRSYNNCGYGSRGYAPPAYPNRAGCVNGRPQANWCPPVYGPQPGCYNRRTMRWR